MNNSSYTAYEAYIQVNDLFLSLDNVRRKVLFFLHFVNFPIVYSLNVYQFHMMQ